MPLTQGATKHPCSSTKMQAYDKQQLYVIHTTFQPRRLTAAFVPVLLDCSCDVALISVCHSPEGAFLTNAELRGTDFKTLTGWPVAAMLVSMLLEVSNLTLHAQRRHTQVERQGWAGTLASAEGGTSNTVMMQHVLLLA